MKGVTMARLTKDVRDYWVNRVSENIDTQIQNLNLRCTEQKESMAKDKLDEFMDIVGAKTLMDRFEQLEKDMEELDLTLKNVVTSVRNSFPENSEVPTFYDYGNKKFKDYKDFFLQCCKNKLETTWLNETPEGKNMVKLREAKNDALDYIFSSDTDLELLKGLQEIVSPLGISVAKPKALEG